ncbi:MAG TPA: iron-sulfur cluster assembly protein [Acidimicrobiales bacterium]|nr:iron-sulfur cluster assembly protein [Acidimicrobiales bacterium]
MAADPAAAWQALSGVRDPELDESVTDLGFVTDLSVDGAGVVELSLRLPTYWCAPNFAYLMVDDAEVALSGVPGVTGARVRLVDHFAAEEINAGVAARQGFAATFPGLAEGELDELRTTFRRKALGRHQYLVCRAALDRGWGVEDLAGATLGDLPDDEEVRIYRDRRAELGIDASPGAAVLVDEEGRAVAAPAAAAHLSRLRLTTASIEGNGAWCRGLLETRYDGCWEGRPGAVTTTRVSLGARGPSRVERGGGPE